jgi:hypothetical protein
LKVAKNGLRVKTQGQLAELHRTVIFHAIPFEAVEQEAPDDEREETVHSLFGFREAEEAAP